MCKKCTNYSKTSNSSGELDKERVYSKMEYTATGGTLTALALLIAESNPNEKELVVNLTRKLLS